MPSLLDWPNEMLTLVRDHIDPYDFLAHVCYLRLCTRTFACYEGRTVPVGLWRRAVRASGLGLSRLEHDREEYWRNVALVCAQHAWTCMYVACGMTKLKECRTAMLRAKEVLPDWDLVELDTFHRTDAYTANTIFAYIEFHNDFPNPWLLDDDISAQILQCAFLEHAEILDTWNRKDLIGHHPIALRSFATLPPLARMTILEPQIYNSLRLEGQNLEVTHVGGITVWDVLTTLAGLLGQRMTCDQLYDLAEPTTFPSTWTYSDILYATSTVRSWFQICRWKGLNIVGHDHSGAAVECEFSRKELPEDMGNHFAKYAGSASDFAAD